MKIGMLTSGGDCQSLNAAMRGVAKTLYNNTKDVEIYGFLDGYKGMITKNYKLMKEEDFSGILTEGGTILGTSRTPFKYINEPDEEGRDKVAGMIKTYKDLKLDCLVMLGGNGSHKTAALLSQKGLNVVTLPKTIDNDIEGTEMSFGFQSAIDVATRTIDEIHTTAACLLLRLWDIKQAGLHFIQELREGQISYLYLKFHIMLMRCWIQSESVKSRVRNLL